MRARCATFSFGIARRTTPTQERHHVDEGRSQGRPRGRAFRVETNKADGATGKVGILRKRPPSFGFPIRDGSSSADHRMGGWLASAMAAAKLARGHMPARRPVPAGSLPPQGLAAATDGLVHGNKERVIALAIGAPGPRRPIRTGFSPGRAGWSCLGRYKFVMSPASMSIRLKWRASGPPAHA
jgi:hypothetical protein